MHIANSQTLTNVYMLVSTLLKCGQMLKSYRQLPNYSLLTIISFTMTKNDPFVAALVLL